MKGAKNKTYIPICLKSCIPACLYTYILSLNLNPCKSVESVDKKFFKRTQFTRNPLSAKFLKEFRSRL